jgi:hypothetical protein
MQRMLAPIQAQLGLLVMNEAQEPVAAPERRRAAQETQGPWRSRRLGPDDVTSARICVKASSVPDELTLVKTLSKADDRAQIS